MAFKSMGMGYPEIRSVERIGLKLGFHEIGDIEIARRALC